MGHPIFMDEPYGGGAINAKSFHVMYTQLINRLVKTITRVALHAQTLGIRHPVTRKKMSFAAPIPKDIITAIEILNNAKS